MAFDIALLILAAIGFVAGYKRGIIYMLFFLIALFLGVFASLKFNYILSDFLLNQFQISGPYMPLLSLVLTFLIVFGVIVWISEMITKLLKLVFLNSINRLLGGALGALAGAAIVSIAGWYVHGLELLPPSVIESSNTFSYCMEFAPLVIDKIGEFIPYMSDLFEQLELMFEERTSTTVAK